MHTRRSAVYRTARYHILGDGPADDLWLACHGYGERAASFLARLDPLRNPGRLIVAPEGLSRFYTDPQHQHVGASWMTREDRQAEIDDYVRWIDTAYADALRRAATPRPRRLIGFGFSQGCATVSRWLAMSACLPAHRCDRLLLWGGTLPPDLDIDRHREWLDERIVFVVGSGDRWLSEKNLEAHRQHLSERGVNTRVERYDGGHGIEQDVLMRVAETRVE